MAADAGLDEEKLQADKIRLIWSLVWNRLQSHKTNKGIKKASRKAFENSTCKSKEIKNKLSVGINVLTLNYTVFYFLKARK
jgi:hypothetical protein